MRRLGVLAVPFVLGVICGDGRRPPGPDLEIDIDHLLEVAAAYEPYADASVLAAETAIDAAGCTVPRWFDTRLYAYDPIDPLRGMGVRVEDRTAPTSELEAERPSALLYHLEGERGTLVLKGLAWYLEPPDGEPLPEQPALFGYPLPGPMEGHLPYQGIHYDLNAWAWQPHPDLAYDYFFEDHPELAVPSWYLALEPTLFAAWGYHDPENREADGFVEVEGCADGEGFRWVDEANRHQLDPMNPDMLLTDVNGLLLGLRWTFPDDGTGPPVLFEQEFWGPDADGEYFLVAWTGTRTSVDYFAERIPLSCDEPPLPPSCLPMIPDFGGR